MIGKRVMPFRVLLTTAAITVAMSSGSVYADEVLNGFIIRDNVQSRYTAQNDGAVTGTFNMSDVTNIKDVYGNWVLIQDGDVSGWVESQNLFIKTESNKLVSFGHITASILNVRQEPDLGAAVIGKLSMGEDVFILDISGDWFFIKNDSIEGWVFSPFVNVELQDKKGKIIPKDEAIEVSRGNETTREPLDTQDMAEVSRGNETAREPIDKQETPEKVTKIEGIEGNVDILDFKDGEYYIKDEKGTFIWMDAQGVALSDSVTEGTPENDKIVQLAKEHLGKPYKWGGNGPSSFDCSGFTRYVYNQVGIQIPRISRDQGKAGQAVKRSDMIPGDLIFFDTTGSMNYVISHVGIYMGDNQFIHASSSSSGKYVRISSLESSFYNSRFVSARRVK